MPEDQGDAVAGAFLYQRYGCINCHGPNGLGGVPNPLSPDLSIPPLVGADFHGEFDDQAIAQIIRDGSVIGKQPIVSMPHWGTILTDSRSTSWSSTSTRCGSRPDALTALVRFTIESLASPNSIVVLGS